MPCHLLGVDSGVHRFARAAHFLGIGVLNLGHIFDPPAVVLGGGISKLGNCCSIQCAHGCAIAPLGDRVGLLGAVAWEFEQSGHQLLAERWGGGNERPDWRYRRG